MFARFAVTCMIQKRATTTAGLNRELPSRIYLRIGSALFAVLERISLSWRSSMKPIEIKPKIYWVGGQLAKMIQEG